MGENSLKSQNFETRLERKVRTLRKVKGKSQNVSCMTQFFLFLINVSPKTIDEWHQVKKNFMWHQIKNTVVSDTPTVYFIWHQVKKCFVHMWHQIKVKTVFVTFYSDCVEIEYYVLSPRLIPAALIKLISSAVSH